MAKRYHQSMKDRIHESRGMVDHNADHFNDEFRHEKDHAKGMLRGPLSAAEDYMGMPTAMRSGLERPEMVYEDHRAVANLPQEVMIKAYPKNGPYMPEVIDDSGRGVDAQMDYDDRQRSRHFYPKKV